MKSTHTHTHALARSSDAREPCPRPASQSRYALTHTYTHAHLRVTPSLIRTNRRITHTHTHLRVTPSAPSCPHWLSGPRKAAMQPRQKLRPLFWTRILVDSGSTGSAGEPTLWDGLSEPSVDVVCEKVEE